jgi:methionyl-tRNA formyltransferase
MGTPDFAVESLRSLVEAEKNIVGVITSPDRKAGRGQKINESAVKKYAVSQNLNVLQPTNLKNDIFQQELKALNADLQIVVAFRMLPESVWNMPLHGTFNLHASLLPQYRGAAPINWAVINGEKETGITTFFLRHEIDTGDIIFQEKTSIESKETAGTLHDKLMKQGGELVLKTVNSIESKDYRTTSQSVLIESNPKINEAPKIFREDCKIDWTLPIEQIDCFIRGLSPYPAAWSTLRHKKSEKQLNVKIHMITIVNRNSNSGISIKSIEGKILIDTINGQIEITSLQVEGKKRMDAKSLLNGFKIEEYELV